MFSQVPWLIWGLFSLTGVVGFTWYVRELSLDSFFGPPPTWITRKIGAWIHSLGIASIALFLVSVGMLGGFTPSGFTLLLSALGALFVLALAGFLGNALAKK